jgi:hypothetical protein
VGKELSKIKIETKKKSFQEVEDSLVDLESEIAH